MHGTESSRTYGVRRSCWGSITESRDALIALFKTLPSVQAAGVGQKILASVALSLRRGESWAVADLVAASLRS